MTLYGCLLAIPHDALEMCVYLRSRIMIQYEVDMVKFRAWVVARGKQGIIGITNQNRSCCCPLFIPQYTAGTRGSLTMNTCMHGWMNHDHEGEWLTGSYSLQHEFCYVLEDELHTKQTGRQVYRESEPERKRESGESETCVSQWDRW